MGIYMCNEMTMYCKLWSELDGTKEKDVICSVIWDFLQPYMNPDKTLVVWSDGCVSQNCCWRVLKFYGWLVRIGKFKKVVIKILHKGHSYCKCDSYFGTIQKLKRHCRVEIPSDWLNVVNSVLHCKGSMFLQEKMWNWSFVDGLFQKRKVCFN